MKRCLLTAVGTLLLAPTASAIIDTNNNGVSDLWERTYNNGELFGPSFAPQADPDADNWTNAQEAAAGANPFDPNPPDGLVQPETAHIPAVYEPDENGIPKLKTPEAVTVTWPTLVGKQYTLLFSPDLSADSWFAVGAPYIGNGNDFVYGFETNDTDSRFWRVAVTDVDSDGDGLTNHEEFLLGSNPLAADTSGDGVPDLWLAFHGFDPAVHHGAILFPGSVHSVVSAFRMGVQLQGGANPGDMDGDGVANHRDADPLNATVRWRRGASPAWMLRFPDVETDASFVSLSPAGTIMFVSPDSTQFRVFTPELTKRTVPRDPPAEGSGFFGPFGLPLHGDRVFGKNLTASSPPEMTWAYLHPADGSVSNAGVPANNPPETIFDATNLHVSGVGGGFGMRTDGVTPLFGGDPGLFESTENALSHGNSLRYWTYMDGTYDAGRLVSASASLPGLGAAVSPSATVALPDGQASTAVHHLVPTSDGLYVAEGGGSFVATTWPAPLLAHLGATRQGWVVDPTANGQRLWVNGRWHPLGVFLPPRASDGAPPAMLTIHQARDTGLIAAGIRYPGDEWKHAILTPVHLRIHHPQQNTTIPWNDYLPGYHLDDPVLCKASDPNHPQSFENLAFDSPQQIVLQFSSPIELADSIDIEIQQVTAHPGWAGNAGDSQEEDFSFSPDSDSRNASAQVQSGSAAITIHCKDYAAWAKLRLILKKNGSPLHPDPILLTLPFDSNGDRIADCWQREQVKDWNRQFRMEPGDLDWIDPDDPQTWSAIFGTDGTADAELADSDGPTGPMPAMTDLGDGLTALDEYRGFFLDGGPEPGAPRHRRLSAARKDLLVECSEMEGIGNTAGSLLMPGFTDPGNDANGFAQAYSLGAIMGKVAAFYASEGPPIQSGANYFPGAAIDMRWVRDTLDDDAANIVYENGSVRSAYKYSGPFHDAQLSGQRQAWLSIYSDLVLLQQNRPVHNHRYGTNANGVGVMGNQGNRNTNCRHFSKLALQGRKGLLNEVGDSVAVSADQAAREKDEAQDPTAPFQGAAIFVNSLSEERNNGQPLASSEVFESKLSYSVAHEVAHLFVIGRNRDPATGGVLPILPFDEGEHIAGSSNLLGGASTMNGIRFHEEEIRKIHLRARASINRTPGGVIQP